MTIALDISSSIHKNSVWFSKLEIKYIAPRGGCQKSTKEIDKETKTEQTSHCRFPMQCDAVFINDAD